LAESTGRGYQLTLRLFCDFVTDPRYGWAAACLERFGQAPSKILHEWNTVAHVSDFEGRPGRRPLTYDEVQALFDAADGRVEEIRKRGRKGALAAMRDAALLKTVYAFGLRRREAVLRDVADLRANPKVRQYGRSVRCSCATARRRGQPAQTPHRVDGAGDGLGGRGR
jgi:integrase